MGRRDDKTHSRSPVKPFDRDWPRMMERGCPFRTVLLSIFLVIGASACDRRDSGESVPEAGEVSKTAQLRGQHDIAGSLIKRSVRQPGGKHVAIEINAEVLEDLMKKPVGDENSSGFRNPLHAAKLFAAHIGLPGDAKFAILEKSQQPEEGSGLFFAIVQVTGGDRVVRMRMISEPDDSDRPTLWVLNDYQR